MNAIRYIETFENELTRRVDSGDIDGIRRMMALSARALADLIADADEGGTHGVCRIAMVVNHTMHRATVVLRDMAAA